MILLTTNKENTIEINEDEFPIVIKVDVYKKEKREYKLVRNGNGCLYLVKIENEI